MTINKKAHYWLKLNLEQLKIAGICLFEFTKSAARGPFLYLAIASSQLQDFAPQLQTR